MKKMSEVFELPVSDMDLAYLTSQAEDGSMTLAENNRCRHAAHAINHVDALADALHDLILSCRHTQSNILACTYAEEALKSYRGDK